VTSVTVPNESVSIVCVHPYLIDTDEPDVRKDPANNALYFPITNNDFINGRKWYQKTTPVLLYFDFDLFFSFLLTRKKLVQNELKLHGHLRIIDSGKKLIIRRKLFFFSMIDRKHIPHITNKSLSKQLIKIYKLWKSQLVFSRAEYVDNNVFNIFSGSSVSSQVMSDEINQQQHKCIKTTLWLTR
jgi:hypothetical protein